MATKKTKASSQGTTDSRPVKRTVRNIVKITFLLLILAVVAYSANFCWRSLYLENPDLIIQNIKVTETENYAGPKVEGKISVDTILSEIGVEAGFNNNIIDLDIRKIRERLEEEPLLKNIEVRKIMPQTIAISFEERVPTAVIIGANTCYIDKDACILPVRYKNGSPLKYDTYGLPIITAVQNPNKLIPGEKTNDKSLEAALSLLDKIQSHPGNSYLKIKQIQIHEKDESLIVRIDPLVGSNVFAQDCVVTFQTYGLDEEIARLFHIATTFSKDKRNIAPIKTLDVSYSQNIPITQ